MVSNSRFSSFLTFLLLPRIGVRTPGMLQKRFIRIPRSERRATNPRFLGPLVGSPSHREGGGWRPVKAFILETNIFEMGHFGVAQRSNGCPDLRLGSIFRTTSSWKRFFRGRIVTEQTSSSPSWEYSRRQRPIDATHWHSGVGHGPGQKVLEHVFSTTMGGTSWTSEVEWFPGRLGSGRLESLQN